MPDLLDAYRAQLAALPSADDDDLTLTGDFTGAPPAEVTSETLVLKARFPGRIYETVRYDLVEFFADKATYRALGLLVFATIFHRALSVVHLAGDQHCCLHGTSITKLVIDSRRQDPDPMPSELVCVPTAFGYWPAPPSSSHPLYDDERHRPRTALPTIRWSDEDDMPTTEADFQTRSVVYGFGEPAAAARMAALFLDFGLPHNTRTEANLEGPAGYQSVSAWSAEACLWVGYGYSV